MQGLVLATALVILFAMGLSFCLSQLCSNCTTEPTVSVCSSVKLLLCTKTSMPPCAGVIKPMPLSSIQALTVPVCIPSGAVAFFSGLLRTASSFSCENQHEFPRSQYPRR